jgi:hypothetical protein
VSWRCRRPASPAASAYALFAADRSARLQAEEIADVVARDLALQQDKLHWVMPSPERFPDLQEVAALVTASGLCVAYRTKSGDVLQRICSGTRPGEADAPELFFGALSDGVRARSRDRASGPLRQRGIG